MILLALAVTAGGAVVVAAGVMAARQPQAADAAAYLRQLDTEFGDEDADDFTKRLNAPFVSRALAPAAQSALKLISRFTPRDHTEQIHHKLLVAGMAGKVRAEEFVTLQVIVAGGSTVFAIFALLVMHGGLKTICALLLFVAGLLGPYAWLNRKAGERQQSILKDLPDVLDLLAISVEAGVGFEGAMDVVCSNLDGALATEFAHTLKEMELGLARREALQNMKRRCEVPELSNFVLAIVQADSLGMPLGRVLHTQAGEQRSRRRQWAREKAGKLPVKILFPLVVFIFPAILVVILGPAAGALMQGFRFG
ncbi:MAG TPA: type II secretion system F family protein [Acidimicrobiales bacterium]|nr:type II secretion system F family protein [Acidimicrobiales bacterium]